MFFNVVDDLLVFHYRDDNISIIVDYKSGAGGQFFGPPFCISDFNGEKEEDLEEKGFNLKKNEENFDKNDVDFLGGENHENLITNNNKGNDFKNKENKESFNKDFLDLNLDFLQIGIETKKKFVSICYIKR